MESTSLKTCCRCKLAQNVGCFTRNTSQKDGLAVRCKTCVQQINREQFERNKLARYEAGAAWRAANPERVLAASREAEQRRRADPVRSAARCTQRSAYAVSKRHSYAMYSAARRVAKFQSTASWADAEFEEFAIAEAYHLAILRHQSTGIKHEVDHIVPLRGKTVCGLHCAANLAVIPAFANRSKGADHWPDMP